MTILQEAEPPPAYSALPSHSPTLSTLPSHVLLAIVSNLNIEDLHSSVRLTSRQFYIVSTYVLKQRLLPSWYANLRDPHRWGSDPEGLDAPSPAATAATSVFRFRTNECSVFDLFVSACALDAANASASSLLPKPSCTPSATLDLFAFLQPKARLADLIVTYGSRTNLVSPTDRDRTGTSSEAAIVRGEDIEVRVGQWKVEVLLPRLSPSGRVHRVVCEVEREKGEAGEALVARCVGRLLAGGVARRGGEGGKGAWYELGR